MIPIVNVTFTAFDQSGAPVVGGRITARLDKTETYNGLVVPEEVSATTDASGVAVLPLWPNALGVAGSLYRVRAWNPDTGRKFLDTTISVPNSNCALEQIIVQEPLPPIDAAQQALVAAQGVLATVTAQAQVTTTKASEAASSAESASSSATTATTKSGEAAASAASSAASATLAGNRAADALTSANSASSSASTATTKAGEAATSASQSATSATTATTRAGEAATSAITATTKAGEASASASGAATSASTATAQAAIATEKASQATASAADALAIYGDTAAVQSAVTSASNSASTATTQASIATIKANAAATSASTATTKAGEALSSANAASASAATAITTHEAAIDPHPQYTTAAEAAAAAPVQSVAGKTGAVTLAKGDVGLGNADNTGDATKAVLSATKLATARTINGTAFDGSADISVSVDWASVTGKPAVIAAGTDAVEARTAIGAVAGDDPRLTDSRTPTGGAGGVLSGSYPNPGFSVDMATQAELDFVSSAKVDKVAGKGLSTEDYSTAEKNKLAGVATGATANSSDAALCDRSTHTGAQAISTVTGLQTALDGKEAAGSAASALSAHVAAPDPHPQYTTATQIHAATAKPTPADADELGITDSAASWGLKKLTFANLKAWISSLGGAGISNTPSGNISATNVQAAINELDSEKVSKTGGTISGNLNVAGNVLATGGGALGYGAGSGGSVTQATSKATAVTLNKPSGQITMNGAALAAGAMVSFSLYNSFITTGDTLVLSMVETFTSTNYSLSSGINSGGASINVKNTSAGSLSQAIFINFAVVKGATS